MQRHSKQLRGEEVTDLRQYTDDWGRCREDKFKDYLLVDEFQNLFVKITDNIKEQEANLRAKTSELDDTVRDMKKVVAYQPRSTSPNSKTNSHLINEMGLLQDEMKRFQRRANEKLSDDMVEIKNDFFWKAQQGRLDQ